MLIEAIFKLSLLLATLLLGVHSKPHQEPVNYDDYLLLRVVPKSQVHLKHLQPMETMKGVEFWKWPSGVNSSVDILVAPETQNNLLEKLNSMKLPFKILMHDVGFTIRSSSRPSVHIETELTQRSLGNNETAEYSGSVDEGGQLADSNYFKNYQSYRIIMAKIKSLAEKYKTIQLTRYGSSYENRPMYLVKMSTNFQAKRPVIFIDAGHHAREWISHSTLVYLMSRLAQRSQPRRAKYDFTTETGNFIDEDNYTTTSTSINTGSSRADDSHQAAAIEPLLDEYDFWFVPVVNPDGYEYSRTTDRLWRKTRSQATGILRMCTGVDPNRNYPEHWREVGASLSTCAQTYAGRQPLSEPETRMIADILKKNKERIVMYLTLHAYSQLILSPYGHAKVYPPTYKEMERVGSAGVRAIQSVSGTDYKFGPSSIVIYPASGGSDDYAYSLGVRFPFTIELPDKGTYGFLMPPEQIVPIGEETLLGILAMVRAIKE